MSNTAELHNPVHVKEGPETHWETILSADEWDALYPGLLDGITALAGMANVVMQLSHPGVGYGVKESKVHSGNIFKRPFKRARTTFTYLAVALTGTREDKLSYRQAIGKAHAQVRSTANSPVKYSAFDSGLQLWVASCIYWGMVDTYEKFHGTLPHEKRARLYQLAKPLGTTLQVRANMWPAELEDFEAYWDKHLNELKIDDTIREYLTELVELRFLNPLVRLPLGSFHRFLTIGFLPQHLRDEMHFTWSDSQEKLFNSLLGAFTIVSKILPKPVRQFPLRLTMWDFRRRIRKGLPLI